MNSKVLKTLEYDKILKMLADQASSDAGRQKCLSLVPLDSLEDIECMQNETADALTRLYKNGNISFGGLKNPATSLKRLQAGGTLNTSELLLICSLLEIARRAKSYSKSARDDSPADSIEHLFVSLDPVLPLLEEIRRCIISPDEIADEASTDLFKIRRQIRNINDRIRTSLNSLITSSSMRSYLQDSVITMRDGRYCLPVRSDSKAYVPGMIHDQSSSGSTVFIEPMSVVRLNNDLKEAHLKEQDEIDRILAGLSSRTSVYTLEIETDYNSLLELDFIFARAKLADSQGAMKPVFNTDGRIKILGGRHPLIDKKKVVPIDVHLGDEFNILIITGPNTGGKTVSLKTVGLLTLMGQSGLHIPAKDRSELSVFGEVFADIGDEQSIEQNLSTFSSHMKNIVSILDNAGRNSLILFDELCAGTDPDEGAALAISILETLRKREVRAMSTTHYSEIKLYALTTKGVENACCEFSVETLSPTYRLLIGIPGKSNAFAISQKLGLPDNIIQDAKTRITEESARFEDVLSDLEQSRVEIEKQRLEIEQNRATSERVVQEIKAKQAQINKSRDKILQEANEQAAAILKEAKDVADASIRNFRKYSAGNADIAGMEKERENVRQKLDKAQKKASVKAKKPINNSVPKKLRVGDSVQVLSMNLKGIVNSLPDQKGNLTVQVGILRYHVNIKDLVLIPDDEPSVKPASKTGAGKIKISKSMNVSPELMLIGKTVDEALIELDKYLDDAYLAHIPSVRIVHGKGTGALRNAVHNHLKKQKYIKEFHLGEFGEGDAGVTIATFK